MPQIVYTYTSRRAPHAGRPNLLVRMIAGAVSVVVLVVSAFLGLFIFLAVFGIMAVAGVILAVWFWLFRRRVETAMKWDKSTDSKDKGYIDVDYEER
jgi:hypothetical protein